jgi:hypothetical protein
MRWRGRANPQLRKWIGFAVIVLAAGLAVHFIGGRQWDQVALILSVAAAVVLIIGPYRHREPPQQ